jgi:hypothetical protein
MREQYTDSLCERANAGNGQASNLKVFQESGYYRHGARRRSDGEVNGCFITELYKKIG